MAKTSCGWCGTVAHMRHRTDLIATAEELDEEPDEVYLQAAYTCANCERLSLATQIMSTEVFSYTYNNQVPKVADVAWPTDTQWLPQHTSQSDFPDVPPHIAAAATEATLCLSIGAHRAVGGLARAVIEATAKDKGITVNGIKNKIEDLEAAGHIRPYITATAHQIREFGNDMAHGDFADPITHDQAADMIALMSEILQEVYQGPARLARVTADREARKTTT